MSKPNVINNVATESESNHIRHRRSLEDEIQDLDAESIAESLPEGFNIDKKENGITGPLRTTYSRASKNLPVLLNIVNGAIWGVLARKGIMELTSYNGSFLQGVIWANFGACVVMGILVHSSNIWSVLLNSQHYPNKASIPLYTGLTTGFCGTFSSFSSVILEAFNKSADTEIGVHYNYPNAAYGIMEFLAVILAQFGLSVMGYHAGKHFIEVFEPYFPKLTKVSYKFLEFISIIVGVSSFIIVCILIGVKDQGGWRSWTFSCLFAPFGALLRFYFSKLLNSKVKNFPLGTFTANFTGTLILSILTLLGRGKLSNNRSGQIVTHILGCHVLTGLDDGFCGALTTVSTFVVEIFGLKTLYSYRYAFVSIMGSYIFVILTLGTYNWRVGLTDPVCT